LQSDRDIKMKAVNRGKVSMEIKSAAEGLRAFVAGYESGMTADSVNAYLCGSFVDFCRALESLRANDSDPLTHDVAKQMASRLMDLESCVVQHHREIGKVPRRSLRRTASVVASVFKPNAFPPGRVPSVLKGKMTPDQYRQRVIDRVGEVVRNSFVWLRDVSRDFERIK